MKRPSWLTTLLENGSVAHSVTNRKILNELEILQIVCVKAAGVRRTVVVTDSSQLTQWLKAKYPKHAIDPEMLPTRHGNIIRSGSSKIGKHSHDVLPFHFKWFGRDNDSFSQQTNSFGMAAVFTDRLVALPMPIQWRLLTVENWEPFYRADYNNASVAVMVVYLGGNVSEILLNALKTFSPPPERVLHFGDYDWEGPIFFSACKRPFHLPVFIFRRILKRFSSNTVAEIFSKNRNARSPLTWPTAPACPLSSLSSNIMPVWNRKSLNCQRLFEALFSTEGVNSNLSKHHFLIGQFTLSEYGSTLPQLVF